MRAVIPLWLALQLVTYAAEAQYLATIQQRRDASDLVCIGVASAPVRTGSTRKIEGSNRDQLSTEVELETCFKGTRPGSSSVRILGYDAVASKDVRGGYIYAGPPTGFVRKRRNLLFLRRTENPREWEIAVPIYETCIRLADRRPYYPVEASPASERFALTQEFEAALVQFNAGDVSDIDRILDLLGPHEGIAELSKF